MTLDPRLERWQGDVERIGAEVQGMHQRREVFRRVSQITENNGALPPPVFFGFVNETYSRTQASAVRRQADRRRDVVSPWRLQTEIRTNPQVRSREWHVAMYGPGFEELERAAWEQYADEGGARINPELVARDLAELDAAAEKAKEWTDAHVAHTGRERLDVSLTYGELDAPIDTIGALMRRYDLLLRATSWVALTPEGIEEDLTALFSAPWIRT